VMVASGAGDPDCATIALSFFDEVSLCTRGPQAKTTAATRRNGIRDREVMNDGASISAITWRAAVLTKRGVPNLLTLRRRVNVNLDRK
jgi:hypothetical protein